MMKSDNPSSQGVHQAVSNIDYAQHTGGASIGNNPFTSRAHNDTILAGLTEN